MSISFSTYEKELAPGVAPFTVRDELTLMIELHALLTRIRAKTVTNHLEFGDGLSEAIDKAECAILAFVRAQVNAETDPNSPLSVALRASIAIANIESEMRGLSADLESRMRVLAAHIYEYHGVVI